MLPERPIFKLTAVRTRLLSILLDELVLTMSHSSASSSRHTIIVLSRTGSLISIIHIPGHVEAVFHPILRISISILVPAVSLPNRKSHAYP